MNRLQEILARKAEIRTMLASSDVDLDALETELDALEAEEREINAATEKRAAMVAYGRERVAALTGPGWASFIAQTAPPGAHIDDLAGGLERLFARPDSAAALGLG